MPPILASGHTDDFVAGPQFNLAVPAGGHEGAADSERGDEPLVVLPTLVKSTKAHEAMTYLDALWSLRSIPDEAPHEHRRRPSLLASLRRYMPLLLSVHFVLVEGSSRDIIEAIERRLNEALLKAAMANVVNRLGAGMNEDDEETLMWYAECCRPALQRCVAAEQIREMQKFLASHHNDENAAAEDLRRSLINGDGDAPSRHVDELLRVLAAASTVSGTPGVMRHVQLTLHDVVGHMSLPCVMDVKLGFVRYHPFTPLPKREKIVAREDGKRDSTVSQFGLRVCGVHHHVLVSSSEREEGGSTSWMWATETCGKSFGHDELCGSDGGSAFVAALTHFACCRRMSSCSQLTGGEGAAAASAAFVGGKALLSKWSSCVAEILRDVKASSDELNDTLAIVSASLIFVFDAAVGETSGEVYLIDFGRVGGRLCNFPENRVRIEASLENLQSFLSRAADAADAIM